VLFGIQISDFEKLLASGVAGTDSMRIGPRRWVHARGSPQIWNAKQAHRYAVDDITLRCQIEREGFDGLDYSALVVALDDTGLV
jgi:hypothetical protein